MIRDWTASQISLLTWWNSGNRVLIFPILENQFSGLLVDSPYFGYNLGPIPLQILSEHYPDAKNERQRIIHFVLHGTVTLTIGQSMKKLKNEKELLKKAVAEGIKYGEKRGVVEFEPTDSASEKVLYIYRLLVHDKVIQPIPEDQVSRKSIQHKLAIWASKLT